LIAIGTRARFAATAVIVLAIVLVAFSITMIRRALRLPKAERHTVMG
jgi:hypothetical protein